MQRNGLSLLVGLSPSENPFFAGIGSWFLIVSCWDLVRKAIINTVLLYCTDPVPLPELSSRKRISKSCVQLIYHER